MKNIGVKIVILGLVITVAVAGVLVFYPTIVAPPVDVPVSNLHKSTLDADIRGFSESETWNYNDSLYNVVVDKIALYKSENFITKGDADSKTNALVQSYVPVFYELCYDKFEASVWYESDHTAMRDRITELRNLKIDNGMSNAVSGSCETSLAGIEKIITDYNNAKSLIASSHSFESIRDANDKITRADEFLESDVLTNCDDLKNGLESVKTNVGNAHYADVEKKIKQLANYRKMTKSQFRSEERTVAEYIDEFTGNESNYGLKKGTADLKNIANQYHKDAEEYFKPRVTIDTNYNWSSKYYQDSSYLAYESYSNYNEPNSEAVMYVDIWGYEEFELYIRSYAESDWDYVTVSELDNSNTVKASTKGNQNSGTSISSYSKVYYRDIDGGAHRITIKYRKDGSNDYYDDRGYVLIPKANN